MLCVSVMFPGHDQEEPMNGGNLRSSISPTSTYKWTQSHTHITALQKSTQEDNFCRVVHLFSKQLKLIFLGKWWHTALHFAVGEMKKCKQLLEVRVLVGKSQMSGFSLVTRHHTEWGLSCRPVWGMQHVQDGKKDFLNYKSKAEKCSRVSLGQQWLGAKKHWGLKSAQLCGPLAKPCTSPPELIWYTAVPNKESQRLWFKPGLSVTVAAMLLIWDRDKQPWCFLQLVSGSTTGWIPQARWCGMSSVLKPKLSFLPAAAYLQSLPLTCAA